jgi:protein PhnA
MNLQEKLSDRANYSCELCGTTSTIIAYPVPPKTDDVIENLVALCELCHEGIVSNDFSNSNHWRALTGSIWSETPAVQALSYSLLSKMKSQDWASETIESVYLDESIISWALTEENAAANQVIHKDAYGNILVTGDSIILTENLNVKGTSYTAPKGTQVKKIRVVADNAEHIEGKINNDTIVILTKFVKKA